VGNLEGKVAFTGRRTAYARPDAEFLWLCDSYGNMLQFCGVLAPAEFGTANS
jgi:hypothetical protein